MKITKRELKQMINESVYEALNENRGLSDTLGEGIMTLNRIKKFLSQSYWKEIDEYANKNIFKNPDAQYISKRLINEITQAGKYFMDFANDVNPRAPR